MPGSEIISVDKGGVPVLVVNPIDGNEIINGCSCSYCCCCCCWDSQTLGRLNDSATAWAVIPTRL